MQAADTRRLHRRCRGWRWRARWGTICYRSRAEFDARFSSRQPTTDARFPVEQFLDHVAEDWGHRYDANCYVLLSHAMDRMDLGQPTAAAQHDQHHGPGHGQTEGDGDGWKAAARRVRRDSEWLVLPVTEDALIPAEESDRWAEVLGAAGVAVHHTRISSRFGHDAFLKEPDTINPRLSAFLTNGDPQRSGVQSVRRYESDLYSL